MDELPVTFDLLPHLDSTIAFTEVIEFIKSGAAEGPAAKTSPPPKATPRTPPKKSKTAQTPRDLIKALHKQLEKNPTPEDFLKMAQLHTQLRRHAHAERYLQQALAMNPDNIALQLELAGNALQQRNYPRVVSIALEVVNKQFDNAHAHYCLGIAFSHLKKYKKAEKALQMAVKLDPQNKDAQDALEHLGESKKPKGILWPKLEK